MSDGKAYFIRRINDEIMVLEEKIAALEQERDLLKKQLAKVKVEQISGGPSVRKNSISRVIAWDSILRTLQASQGPVSSSYLFEVLKSANRSLNHSTFRTYLNRMQQQGLIRKSSIRGSWQLVEKSEVKKS